MIPSVILIVYESMVTHFGHNLFMSVNLQACLGIFNACQRSYDHAIVQSVKVLVPFQHAHETCNSCITDFSRRETDLSTT